MLIQAVVVSYFNCICAQLYGIPVYTLDILQQIQITVGWVVKLLPRKTYVTPVLRDLHWLPVPKRIKSTIPC